MDGRPAVFGKVGAELSEQDGYQAARLAGLNLISQLKREIGELDRVVQFVKSWPSSLLPRDSTISPR